MLRLTGSRLLRFNSRILTRSKRNQKLTRSKSSKVNLKRRPRTSPNPRARTKMIISLRISSGRLAMISSRLSMTMKMKGRLCLSCMRSKRMLRVNRLFRLKPRLKPRLKSRLKRKKIQLLLQQLQLLLPQTARIPLPKPMRKITTGGNGMMTSALPRVRPSSRMTRQSKSSLIPSTKSSQTGSWAIFFRTTPSRDGMRESSQQTSTQTW